MPTARRSAEFDENKSPNSWKKSPIKTSTFYGSSSYVPRYLSSSFTEKMNIKTPPKEKITTEKKKKTSLGGSKPKSKSGTKFGREAGGNKGVSHAIQKPKIKKPEKQKSSKSGTESASSDLEDLDKIFETKKNGKTPKLNR